MKRIKKSGKLFFLSFFMLLLSSCALPGLGGDVSSGVIRIAGGNNSENQILAEIDKQMIEHYTKDTGQIINNLGSNVVIHHAMLNGDADISASRFTGTNIADTLKMAPETNSKKALRLVQTEFKKRFNETWLPSYGFGDAYCFIVTQETAEKYHLKKISDMAKVSKNLVTGADAQWMDRDGDGYPDFKKKYGFDFKKVYPMQNSLLYDALHNNKMDVIVGYSTDGRIASYHLKILEDDRAFFPSYDCSIVMNPDVIAKKPEIKPVLEKLIGKIDLSTMQKLNYKADNDLEEPSKVAKDFLEAHHYFEK